MVESFEQAPEGIGSRMVTLAGLLNQPWTYRIPAFQRPYSWMEEHVERLVEDVRSAAAYEYPYYFLGHIVVVRAGPAEVQVVDGQQRLITLTILLAYLRDKLAEKRKDLALALQQMIAPMPRLGKLEPHAPVRVLVRPADQGLMRAFLQQPGRMLSLTGEKKFDLRAQMLMRETALIIIDALDRLTEEERASLTAFLMRRVTFNLIETEDRDGASMLFRVLNETGLQLNNSSIIKTEVFERAGLEEAEANLVAERWDRLEDELGEEAFKDLLDQMPVIFSQRAYQKQCDVGVFRRAVIDVVDARLFLRQGLWDQVEAFKRIDSETVEAGEHTSEVNRRLRILKLYREKSWVAPALAFLAKPREPAAVRRFFVALERLTFAGIMGLTKNHTRRIERFAEIVKVLDDETALYNPKALKLALAPDEHNRLIQLINNDVKSSELRRTLALRANAAMPQGEVFSGSFKEATVEHVLPLADTEYWIKRFPNAARREEFKNLLGNFALLTQKQNDDAANRTFPEKRELYFGAKGQRPRAPVRALTEDLRAHTEWNEQALMIRHDRLVAHLCNDLEVL